MQKADWSKAPDWATKYGQKIVVHGEGYPVWYNSRRACSAIDVPELGFLQAIQFKPCDSIELVEVGPKSMRI